MPDYDSAANAQVDSGAFAPADLIFIDFVDDPLRATTFGRDLTFAGTGDPDLDGHTFLAFDGSLVDVGEVSESSDGSDTLPITLSGVKSIDDALMAEINDRSKWQGRLVRLWQQIYDVDGDAQQGATIKFYTGYASKIVVKPGPQSSTIEMSVEKWLASSSQASNRSWLAQSLYDPNDKSAEATLAAANMGRGASSSAGGTTAGTGVSSSGLVGGSGVGTSGRIQAL